MPWSCRAPASSKSQAEAEGLDKIFMAAGFEWREPGCSMCLAMNPDKLAPGERCASTSNRNFEGRQGFKGRTHLVSPAMAAAAAIAGRFVDIGIGAELRSAASARGGGDGDCSEDPVEIWGRRIGRALGLVAFVVPHRESVHALVLLIAGDFDKREKFDGPSRIGRRAPSLARRFR